MRKRRGVRWRRVVAWWVVLTVVLTVVGVGALAVRGYQLTRATNMYAWASSVGADFEHRSSPDDISFYIHWRNTDVVATRTYIGLQRPRSAEGPWPQSDVTRRDPQTWLSDSEIEASFAAYETLGTENGHGRRRALQRVRDFAAQVLPEQLDAIPLICVDFNLVVPLGLAASTHVTGRPLRAQRVFTLMFPLEGGHTQVHVRLWNMIGVAGGMSGIVLCCGAAIRQSRRAIRRRRGGCAGCGYALQGIAAEAVCPECGEGR